MTEQKRKAVRPSGVDGGEAGSAEVTKKGKKLIDEIDDILEKNAEEFVKSYVQRGGE